MDCSQNTVPQYTNAFDFEFDFFIFLQPGMDFYAQFEDTAGADGAGAENVAHAQAGVLRCPGDHLREAVVNLVEVAARDFFAIDAGDHLHVVAFARAAARAIPRQFIGRDQPGAERGSEIFAFAGAEIELHVATLEVARAPVVHDGIARDILVGLFHRNVFALAPDDAGDLQFDIQFLAALRVGNGLIGAVDFARIGEVENWHLVPFGNHAEAAQGAGGLDMLLKGVEIADRGRLWNGGQGDDLVERVGLARRALDVHAARARLRQWGERHLDVARFALIYQSLPRRCQPIGVTQQFQKARIVKLEDLVAADDARVGGVVGCSEGEQLHLQISSQFLLALQRLEEGLEVAFAEAARALALDDLEEDRRAAHNRFGEDLQQVAFIVVIDQNAQFGQVFYVLSDVADALQHVIVVG